MIKAYFVVERGESDGRCGRHPSVPPRSAFSEELDLAAGEVISRQTLVIGPPSEIVSAAESRLRYHPLEVAHIQWQIDEGIEGLAILAGLGTAPEAHSVFQDCLWGWPRLLLACIKAASSSAFYFSSPLVWTLCALLSKHPKLAKLSLKRLLPKESTL